MSSDIRQSVWRTEAPPTQPNWGTTLLLAGPAEALAETAWELRFSLPTLLLPSFSQMLTWKARPNGSPVILSPSDPASQGANVQQSVMGAWKWG